MAKDLLLQLLVDVLGKYVEGLTGENLKVGVWAGKIELKNLKLKSSALDELNLPIHVSRGTLTSLKLKIPWAHLSSKPVLVQVDGIYLEARPVDLMNIYSSTTTSTAADSQQLIYQAKMKILDAVERAITSRLHAKESLLSRATSQKASYMQKLSTKILDNLEVAITRVHLRYEDNQSIPNTVFAGGITMDGLTLMTTDERWSSAFISRKMSDATSPSSSSSCIHKLGTVNGLGVYWNTHSSSSDDLSSNQWDAQMMNVTKDSQQREATAASTSMSTSIDTVSILQPMNRCSLRIKHQTVAAASTTAACTDNSPTIDMTIDSTDLHLQLSDLQYRQMLTALQYFRVLDTRRLLVSHRPTNRPTADPRAWWHYAYKLLTGRENVGNNNKFQLMIRCRKAYRLYVPHYKKNIIHQEVMSLLGFTEDEIAQWRSDLLVPTEIRAIEESKSMMSLPLSVLISFRQIAAWEAVVEVKRLQTDPMLLKQYMDRNAMKSKKTITTASSSSNRLSLSNTTSSSATTVPSSAQKPSNSKKGLFSFFNYTKKKAPTPSSSPTDDHHHHDAKGGVHVLIQEDPGDGSIRIDSQQQHDDPESELSIEQLEATFDRLELDSEEAAAAGVFPLRLRVASSIVMELLTTPADDDTPSRDTIDAKSSTQSSSMKSIIVKLGMSFNSIVEMRSSAITMQFQLTDLYAIDLISVLPISASFVSVRESTAYPPSQQQLQQQPGELLPLSSDSIETAVVVAPPAPTLNISFSSGTGASKLQLQAKALMIVWNEPCIRSLLRFFSTTMDSQEALIQKTMIMGVNNIFSSSALSSGVMSSSSSSYASSNDLVIQMEMQSPTFIFPEHFDSEHFGCLRLQTGHLSITGRIDASGLVLLDLTLRDINASMPTKYCYEAIATENASIDIMGFDHVMGFDPDHTASYLLKPCDMKCTIRQQTHPEEAELLIDVSLAPYVDACIDAIKLVRLQALFAVFLRSITVQSIIDTHLLHTVGITTGPSPPASTTSSSSSSSSSYILPQKIDFVRISENITCNVEQVVVVLALSKEHSLKLSLKGVKMQVFNRLCDTTAVLSMKRFELMDVQDASGDDELDAIIIVSTAIDHHPSISDNRSNDTSSSAVEVVYRSISSSLSPLYTGFYHDISVLLSDTTVTLSPLFILSLVPFISELKQHYIRYCLSEQTIQQSYSTNNGFITTSDGSNSIKLTSSIRSITINLLLTQDSAPVSSTIIISGDVPLTVKQKPVDIIAFVIRATQLFVDLGYGCSFDTKSNNNINNNYNNNDPDRDLFILTTTASMQDVSIQDERITSKAYIHRTILTSNRSSSSSSTNEDCIVVVDTISKSEHILTVEVKTTSKNESSVTIKLDDVHAFIAIDILLAFVKLVRINTTACIELLDSLMMKPASNGCSVDESTDDAVVIKQHAGGSNGKAEPGVLIEEGTTAATETKRPSSSSSSPSSSSSLPPSSSYTKVSVHLTHSKLFLLEDPMKSDSKAFVSEVEAHVLMVRKVDAIARDDSGREYSRVRSFVSDTMYVALKGFDIRMCLDIRDILTRKGGCGIRDSSDADGINDTNPREGQMKRLHVVVEATNVDIQLKQSTEDNVLLLNDVKINSEGFTSSVSLNDIILCLEVLDRAKLKTAEVYTRFKVRRRLKASTAATTTTTTTTTIRMPSTKLAVLETVSAYKLFVSVTRLEMTLIDDLVDHHHRDRYHQQDYFIPIARLCVQHLDFNVCGPIRGLDGEGSFLVTADYYYNAGGTSQRISKWEPILERWHPTIRLTSDVKGIELCLRATQDLQLDITTSMCVSLHKCYALVSERKNMKRVMMVQSQQCFSYAMPLVIINELGTPIDIVNSKTRGVVASLSSDNPVYSSSSPSLSDSSSSSTVQFDVYWKEEQWSTLYQPILQIAASNVRCKSYQLKLLDSLTVDRSALVRPKQIEVQVFENQRFSPLLRAWSEPWLTMGDPTMWSDPTNGYPSPDKDLIQLPIDKDWKWLDDAWRIDRGIRGVETDADGWQYETNFSSFSSSRLHRRTQRPNDNVRRRRWLRTRQCLETARSTSHGSSTSSSISSSLPVHVAWDVKLIDKESRQITISSGCHVNNQSSYDLEIVFSNEADLLSRSDDEDICRHLMMTVHEGVMNAAVPLDMMRYNCFQIRPTRGRGNSDLHSQYYQWSEKVKYKLSNRWSALKSTYQKRVVCRRLHGPILDRGDTESLYYSLHFLEVDRKLLVTISSGLIIVNRLPCPVSAMCYNAKTPATATAAAATIRSLTPSQSIESGASSSRPHVDVTSPMSLLVRLGDLISTEPLLIPPLGSSSINDTLHASPHEYQVFFFKSNDSLDFVSNNNHNHNPQLNLTVKTSLTDNGCLQVTIFSQFLLLDLSSTGIVVSSECDSPSSLQSTGRSSLQSTGRSSLQSTVNKYSSSKVDNSIITINRYSCSSDILFATEKKRMIEEVLLQSDSSIWLQRDVGVSLFQGGRDNSISMGVFCGKEGWYPNLSMDSLNSKKTAIEIIDTRSRNAVNIALTLTPLTAINSCSQTHLLTVIPCYVVVNYMDEPIEFLHPFCSTQTTESSASFSHLFIVPAKSSQPWHRPATIPGTAIRLRTASSMASIGSVDLNEIGTTLLVLPIQLQPTSSSSSSSNRRTTQIVAHIEVKLAEDSDLSYMNIVVWQSIVPVLPDGLYDISLVSLSVRNETEIPFTLFQEDIVDIVSKKYNECSSSSSSGSRSVVVIITEMIRLLEVCVEPGDCIPFGWVDASAPKKIAICAGKQANRTKPLCTIDTLLTSVEERIDMSYLSSSSKNSISVSFHTSGNGKVLIIKYNTMKNSPALHFYDDNDDEEEDGGGGSISNSLFGRALCLKLFFHGINVSMIADAPPMRRELFQACIQETTITLTKTAKDESMRRNIMFELAVKDVQIDNYCVYSTYPVLLSSSHSQYRRNALKDQQRKQYFTGSGSKLSNGNDDTTTSSTTSSSTTTTSNYSPFVQFLVIQEVPPIGSRENRSTIIKYLALRVLQFQVSVDASSIIAYFTDLHPSYNFRPKLIDANAVVNPQCRDNVEQCQSKLQAFNQRVSSLLQMSCDVNTAVDVERAYRHAIAHKVCFESIIMHPFSITLTFSPNQIDRYGGKTVAVRSSSRKIKLVHTLCSLPAIDGFDVHVGSFIVNYAMESVESMRKRITLKTELELRSNLIQLGGSFIGSMSILGKPAGMLKNIGGGVQDLFYEPYLGLMVSPGAFVAGLGKGTGLFVVGLTAESMSLDMMWMEELDDDHHLSFYVDYYEDANDNDNDDDDDNNNDDDGNNYNDDDDDDAVGVVGTAATMVSSATGGMSSVLSSGMESITGDDDYSRTRETKKRANAVSQGGGMISGLIAGGESLFDGVTSGITGLVTKPIQEGKKTGALGFMKGVGMGIAGVAVKPVLGLTDGLSSIASGLNQQINNDNGSTAAQQIRPMRTFEVIDPLDLSYQLLVPLDLYSANVQSLILRLAVQNDYEDIFLDCCGLGFDINDTSQRCDPTAAFAIALSTSFIFCLSNTYSVLWKISYSIVSHASYRIVDGHQQRHTVDFVLYGAKDRRGGSSTSSSSSSSSSNSDIRSVVCASSSSACKLYQMITKFSHLLGNPSKLIPIEQLNVMEKREDNLNTALNESNSSSSSVVKDDDGWSRIQQRLDIMHDTESSTTTSQYEFPTACPYYFPSLTMSDADIISTAEHSLLSLIVPTEHTSSSEVLTALYKEVDRSIWQLLSNWRSNHSFMHMRRCSVCLIINNSRNNIQFTEYDLKEGRSYHIFSVGQDSYDHGSGTLLGQGGSMVTFVYGKVPSVVDLSHVKLKLHCTAFSAMISTRKHRTTCMSNDGYLANFVHKIDTSDLWSKSVIEISS